MRRPAIAFLLAALLAGCGGGTTLQLSIRGASESTYNYIEGGVLKQASPSLVDQLRTEVGIDAVNHSVNGLKLAEQLAGGPVELAVPPATLPPLQVALATEPLDLVLVGVGMNDALFGATTADEYGELVRRTVATYRALGKTPILRGYNRFVTNEIITPQRQARLAHFEAVLRGQALALDVAFLDIGSVEFHGTSDIRADGLHATAAYNLRIARFIARRVLEIAGDLHDS